MLYGDDKNSSNLVDNTYTNWLVVYIVLGIAVYFFAPYPISFVASLVIIVLMMISLGAYIMKKVKLDENKLDNHNNTNDSGGRIRGLFDSLSLSLYDDPNGVPVQNQLKFYCMSCGKDHKKRKCPSCGSMKVRVGWEIKFSLYLFFIIIIP